MEVAEKSSRDLIHVILFGKRGNQPKYIRVTLEYSSAWYLFLRNTQWQELSKHVLYRGSAIKQLRMCTETGRREGSRWPSYKCARTNLYLRIPCEFCTLQTIWASHRLCWGIDRGARIIWLRVLHIAAVPPAKTNFSGNRINSSFFHPVEFASLVKCKRRFSSKTN